MLSGSLVTPKKIPITVVRIIVIIIPPGTFFTFITSIMINPIRATITVGEVRSPNARLFFPSAAAISPQLFAPSRAMNSPIPALTACFKLTGITRTTASRNPRKEIAINRTPLQKITPAAISALIPSLPIMDATIPTLPSPGARAKGRLV